MLDLGGLQLSSEERELLAEPLVGGIIIFARNYSSPDQLHALVAEIRSIRPELLLAVDQEGGRVQRFKSGFTALPSMQSFLSRYREKPQETLELVRDAGWLMAAEVLSAGLDFSFAPVLDVDDVRCEVIADRSFSPDPLEVVDLAGAFIDGMHEAGMSCTGKHFPGHGGVSGDSHLLLPVDDRSWPEIERRDWMPFARLAPRLDAVMPAHIVFSRMDSQPVGFSSFWLQQKLRGDLGFNGVIFSDDLSMEGAAGAGNYGDRAELALAAGCDMVLVCNNRAGALEVLQRLKHRGQASSERLSSMRRRREWSMDELQKVERWQNTRDALSALLSTQGCR